MRLIGYSISKKVNNKELFAALKEANEDPAWIRDVVHIGRDKEGDIFVFPFGAVVIWGLEQAQELGWIQRLHPFLDGVMAKPDTERFTFTTGTAAQIRQDEVTLPYPSAMNKLAVSYAIAQSLKLAIFEESIRATITKTEYLPKELKKKGRISLSRKEISKTIGGLFVERNSVNLHTDILDTPEVFWEFPEHDALYRMTAQYLDLNPRVNVLNQRLNIVKELLDVLVTELNHLHTARLEWVIIVLILFEVIIGISREVLH